MSVVELKPIVISPSNLDFEVGGGNSVTKLQMDGLSISEGRYCYQIRGKKGYSDMISTFFVVLTLYKGIEFPMYIGHGTCEYAKIEGFVKSIKHTTLASNYGGGKAIMDYITCVAIERLSVSDMRKLFDAIYNAGVSDGQRDFGRDLAALIREREGV